MRIMPIVVVLIASLLIMGCVTPVSYKNIRIVEKIDRADPNGYDIVKTVNSMGYDEYTPIEHSAFTEIKVNCFYLVEMATLQPFTISQSYGITRIREKYRCVNESEGP